MSSAQSGNVREWPHPPYLRRPGRVSGADATRERLLHAAHELLYERMGAPVSVSEICARAGANVAMVKYCFGGKDALLDSLVERVMEQFPPEIERLAQLDMQPADKLRRHVAEIVRNYVRYPYVNRLMNERLLAWNSEAVERMSRAFAIPARNLYRQLLDEGRREDGWREIDPTLFFFMVIGVCEFVFSARPWLEQAFEQPLDDALVERFINEATELVVRGVGGT